MRSFSLDQVKAKKISLDQSKKIKKISHWIKVKKVKKFSLDQAKVKNRSCS